MARQCMITGKGTVRGNNVSHSNRRTKRLFKANVHWKRFWVPAAQRFIRLRVSAAGLRLIDKHGIEFFIAH